MKKVVHFLSGSARQVAWSECSSDWYYSGGCGFNPLVWQHSFMEIGHEIISTIILSLPLIQVDSQLVVKGCARSSKYCLTAFKKGPSLPRKSVDRLTDCLDMTTVVHWDVKQQTKQYNRLHV